VAKVPAVVEHVRDIAEAEKVVVFAHHHDVIDALATELKEYDPVVVDGRVSAEDRHERVQRFQTDPDCRIYIGSITASGVGITLTAASRVVFAELDWVPGNITQAEDRLHRIGQRDTVFVQHLVVDGSLDARMAEVLVEKQRVADEALDAERAKIMAEPLLPTQERRSVIRRSKLEEIGRRLSAEDRRAVLVGIRAIAAACDGAHHRDGYGFSKVDARLGHRLAESTDWSDAAAGLAVHLCRRYQRQLEEFGCGDTLAVVEEVLGGAR
jgi:hypothetical protein